VVATVTSDGDAYAREVADALKAAGVRAELDLRNEKINYKVREHSLAKVPYLVVVGRREAEQRAVALRRLKGGEQFGLALEEAVNRLAREAAAPGT
jgi:threonyl-tRNA synthetase